MTRRSRALVAVLLAALATLLGLLPATAHADPDGTLTIQTVPPIAGVRFAEGANVAVTDADGVAVLKVDSFVGLDERFKLVEGAAGPGRRVLLDRVVGTPERSVRKPLVVGLRTERRVRIRYLGPQGDPVDYGTIDKLVLRSSLGEKRTVSGAELADPMWVSASRTQQTPQGLISKDLYWAVSRVVVRGAEVVNKSQQKFFPNTKQDWPVGLLFYQVSVTGLDQLFGGHAGKGVELIAPDGTVTRHPFTEGAARLVDVPRAVYQIRVYGGGISFVRPLGISKDQLVELKVITPLDLAVVVSAVLALAVGLVVVGRRHRLRAYLARRRGRGRDPDARSKRGELLKRAALVLVTGGVLLAPMAAAPPTEAGGVAPDRPSAAAGRKSVVTASPDPTPTLAYYYIWFNPTSWRRAKTDLPLLGNYSSADPEVMRQHIELAQSAGIDGFLVSWKHTAFLDPRLEQLVERARAARFRLGIVYQGLDFHRRPLPVDTIAADLRWFADRYADEEVFDLFGGPVVVLTGTEQFSAEDLHTITDPVRGRLKVLASAKNVEDYERTAAAVDGNAYYWSSADPAQESFAEKLARMGAVVRTHGGLWLAPAPAGFDARLLGGTRVVPRRDGETLRSAIHAAQRSLPDGVAVISWNEFSENSHIEPSENLGAAALQALADVTGARVDVEGLPDSSEAAAGVGGLPSAAVFTFVGAALAVLAGFAVARRNSNRRRPFPSGPVAHRGVE